MDDVDLVYTKSLSLKKLILSGQELKHLEVVPEFCSHDEEREIMVEVDRALRRKRYEYDHWDDVSAFANNQFYCMIPSYESLQLKVHVYLEVSIATAALLSRSVVYTIILINILNTL